MAKKIKQSKNKNLTSKENTQPVEKTESIIKVLVESKILAVILLIAIIAGVYFRVTDYALEGISTDSITTLTGGLLWFYPHTFYPGLIHYQPPVGHYLIGKSCMTSGQDFSEVSKSSPYFIPTMPLLIGEPFTKAENNCFLVIYISSLMVFLGLILLSYTLLDAKSFVYATVFFALFPTMLIFGRTIIVEVITWLFAVYGILALWKFYSSKKGSKEEIIYFTISAIIFALATATKFTSALYIIFSFFILLEKYQNNVKATLTKGLLSRHLLYNAAIFVLIFTITLLVPFQMNIKNLQDVYNAHKNAFPGEAKISLGTASIDIIKEFTIKSNPLDMLIIVYSIYILYRLLIKKEKSGGEKYILYLCILFIISTTLFSLTLGYRRAILFFIGVPLMASLTFSDKEYSIFNTLQGKLNVLKASRKTIFISIILIYIISSSFMLYAIKPYYSEYANPVACAMFKESCTDIKPSPIFKTTADELKKILKDNETFYVYPENVDTYMYLNQKDYYTTWYVKTQIAAQKKGDPSLEELIRTYNNITVQYGEKPIKLLVMRKQDDYADPLAKNLANNYIPEKIVTINNIDVAYIYRLQDPKPKNTVFVSQ